MKTAENIFIYIAVMALVTYLIRMLPLVIFAKNRKQIYKIVSLLHSVCSLGGDDISGGFFVYGKRVVGCGRAYSGAAACVFEKGLLTVALSSCVAVFVIEFLIKIIS